MFNEPDMAMATEVDPLVVSQFDTNIPLSDKQNQRRTVQDVINEYGFNTIHICFIFALGAVAMSDSMQVAFVAIVLPMLKCEWDMSPTVQGLTTAVIFSGTGIGALVIGNLSDRYGRKTTALASVICLFLSMTITSFSESVLFFVVFATIAGVCCGGSTAISYTMWAEVSPEEHRNNGVMVISLMWNGGFFLSNFIGFLVLNRVGWKMYALMMGIPSLVPIVFLILLPESPKYLYSKNKLDKLYKSMAKITKTREEDMREIMFEKEMEDDELLDEGGILTACINIFSAAHRTDTFKVIALYVCLQFLFKGIGFLLTIMTSTDYCSMGSTGLIKTAVVVEGGCDVLSNTDLINGMLLSVALFISTIVTVLFSNRIGDILTLRLLSIGSLCSFTLLLFCMGKGVMLFVAFMAVFFVSGVGIIMFIILPKMFPTISRNSGFGLVDGIGKIVASTVVFLLTAMLNYSIRYSISLFIFVSIIQIIFSLIFSFKTKRSNSNISTVAEE